MISSKIGNFFFKIRSFTPIPFIFALLYFAKPVWHTVAVGVPFIVIGELLRIWAVGYAGASTRARTLGAARDLVTTGPYGYVRNPLYLGNFPTQPRCLPCCKCLLACCDTCSWLFLPIPTDYCVRRGVSVGILRFSVSSLPRTGTSFCSAISFLSKCLSPRFFFRTRHKK